MPEEKKYRWFKIAESLLEITQRGERNCLNLTVAGRELLIIHQASQLYACQAKCPHAGGLLLYGRLDEKAQIICPVHQYKFSLVNGRNSSGEGYHLKTFPIKETDDGVFVGFDG